MSGAAGSPPDPWKGLRGVMSATLLLQAVVVLLALPVLAKSAGMGWWQSGAVLALAGLLVVACALQRRRWALGLNLALTGLMAAAYLIHPAIGVLGLLFGVVWGYIIYLRAALRRRLS